jgi:cytochrome c peroxidase
MTPATLKRSVILIALSGGLRAEPYHWDLPKGFPRPRVPAGNLMSEAKVKLGRYLFYDTRLSVNGTFSCASCHKQELAFTDGRAVPIGATGESHSRSAMTLVNVAYSSVLTWSDPGMRSLETQALVPMLGEHPVELGLRGREQEVIAKLRAEPIYTAFFPQAFPGTQDAFTFKNVANALASFERTIISARSPWDRFHTGGDQESISESAKRGEVVFFNGQNGGQCLRCHNGFNLSDATDSETSPNVAAEFHNTALYNLPGLFSYPQPNLGIYSHTKKASDVGKFKAPTLRNIALTAPYMHDGSIATLEEEVIEHYASGGRAHDNPNRDPRMAAISLTHQNKLDLLEFLRSLTDTELIHDPRFSNPWE